jgi:YVTN family beta-propeller protein
VDANTYEVLNTIPVGKRPWGITFSPDGKYLFAANGPSDDLSVVDLVTQKQIARIKSPGSPWGVVCVPHAQIFHPGDGRSFYGGVTYSW